MAQPQQPQPDPMAGTAGHGGKQPIRELHNGAYGENKQFVQQQQGAPLPQAPDFSDPQGGAQMPPSQPMTGFDHDESTRPDEPVTAGSPLGPGAGPEDNAQPASADPGASYGPLTQMLSQFTASDTTGTFAALLAEAQNRGIA
jgi:hypothetical protein